LEAPILHGDRRGVKAHRAREVAPDVAIA